MPIKNNGIEESIVVPAKSLMELSRLIDDEDESMTVYVDNNFVMVDLFHTKIVTRLIAESYISYSKSFLPHSTPKSLSIKRFLKTQSTVFHSSIETPNAIA